MQILFLIAFIAFVASAGKYGIWYGLAIGFGTFFGLIACLLIVVSLFGRRKKAPASGNGPVGDDLRQTSRSTQQEDADEQGRHEQRLQSALPSHKPSPAHSPATFPAIPDCSGQRAEFIRLMFDFGKSPSLWLPRENRSLTDRRQVQREFYIQLYCDLHAAFAKHAAVESSLNIRSAVMVEQQEIIARVGDDQDASDIFIAFRSLDGVWGGFSHANQSFRFPLQTLAGLQLAVGMPAKGGGGYDIGIVFDAPVHEPVNERTLGLPTRPPSESFSLHLSYSIEASYSLLRGLTSVAHFFEVPISCEEYSDC